MKWPFLYQTTNRHLYPIPSHNTTFSRFSGKIPLPTPSGNPFLRQSPPHANERKELLTGLGLIEGTTEITCSRNTTLLLYATHLHAHMLRLHNNHDTLRMQSLLNSLTDLLRQSLLQLKAMTEHVHHTRYLAQPRDLSVGNIRHMHATIERQHVMLTERVEVDVLYDNHLITAFLVENSTTKNAHSILLVTARQVKHGPGHTQWSTLQTLTLRILTQQLQYPSYMLLYLLPRRSQVLLF